MKQGSLVIIAKEINNDILNYYITNSVSIDIFVVSPECTPNIQNKYPSIRFINDHDILDRSNYKEIEKTNRPNWYYQQFLKYSVVIHLYKEFNYELIHILDGDSFIRKDIFLNEKIFYTSKNIEEPYKNFINKLGIKLQDDKNFISNQMCFRPKYLIEMLDEISNGKNWISYFLQVIIENKDHEYWFSEYQLYACYIKHTHSIEETPLKVFRRLDLIEVPVEAALKKYFVVAKEIHHKRDFLRMIRAYIYYILGKNLG